MPPSTTRYSSSYFTRLYTWWLTLRLPWRRRFLAGVDLQQNRYFYFRPTLGHRGPLRRIMQPSSTAIFRSKGTLPVYSDVQVPIQWHQWLRFTRSEAPTTDELWADEVRKEGMKGLVAGVEQRWREGKKRVSGTAEDARSIQKPDEPGPTGNAMAAQEQEQQIPKPTHKEKEPSPWDRADRKTPGEAFQPEAWTPSANIKTGTRAPGS